MRPVRTGRRWWAVATIAAIAGLAVATPATAQPAGVSLDVYVADVFVTAGGSAEASVVITPSESATFEDLYATFDFSGLAGVAEPDPGGDTSGACTVTGPVVDCFRSVEEITEHGLGTFTVAIDAVSSATAGDSGPLQVSVGAIGVDEATDTATVTVAAPVDLVGDHTAVDAVAPGGTVPYAPTVRNEGPEEAHGVALWAALSYLQEAQTRYSNCTYFAPGFTIVFCSFDAVVESGSTYTLEAPMEIGVATDHPAPSEFSVEGSWMTHAQRDVVMGEYVDHHGLTGTPGDGPELVLVHEDGTAPPAMPEDPVPAVDTDRENNSIPLSIKVAGDATQDFAAVGASISGSPGDEVDVSVGVENVGTAAFDGSRVPVSANYVLVTIPDGTTATSAPDECMPVASEGVPDWDNAGRGGEPEYLCRAGEVLRAGESDLFDFTLRIDDDGDLVGSVEVNQINQESGPDKPEDADPTNDTAEIVVETGTGGEGGELPVTGGVVAAASIAGLLMLGLGAAGVLLARRRRTHFVS